MSFRISGLEPAPFEKLFGLPTAELDKHGVERCVADRSPGFPDRIELRDAEPGETLLLLNYLHQPAATPYRASHAIFVLEGAREAFSGVDEVPPALRRRTLSLRAFDAGHRMLDAALVDGQQATDAVCRLLANRNIAYLQAHYALRGCYAALIERD